MKLARNMNIRRRERRKAQQIGRKVDWMEQWEIARRIGQKLEPDQRKHENNVTGHVKLGGAWSAWSGVALVARQGRPRHLDENRWDFSCLGRFRARQKQNSRGLPPPRDAGGWSWGFARVKSWPMVWRAFFARAYAESWKVNACWSRNRTVRTCALHKLWTPE